MDAYIEAEGLDGFYQQLIDDRLVVFTGMSGVGKTVTAHQLAERFRPDNPALVLGKFNCFSKEDLISDMDVFSSDHGLHHRRNEPQELEEAFKEFYNMVNESFRDFLKCFIFDDAEQKTNLIKLIDSIVSPTAHKNKWMVIVTTQDGDVDQWLYNCENVPENPFVTLEGFTTNDVLKLFGQSSNGHGADQDLLDEPMAKKIIEMFGKLPVILQLVKSEITASTLLPGIMETLKNFEAKINDADRNLNNRALAAIHVSLSRVADECGHPERCKELMRFITMFDEKYLMGKLLIACAEVIVPRARWEPYDLANSLASVLEKRFLCIIQLHPDGHYITISLCKLVKQSMMLFRVRNDAASEVAVSQKALLAVTRVMPKDGRGHESHAMYRYMYNHGRALEAEILKQKGEGHVNRIETPEILMMCADLFTAMGYCQLAFRSHTRYSSEHFDKAFNLISEVIDGRRYDQLDAGDEPRAKCLYDAGSGEISLHTNSFYTDVLVPSLPYYVKVTEKDLPNMLPFKENLMQRNGHLFSEHVQEMSDAGNVLTPHCLTELYPLELLAELYSIKSKAYEFQLRKTGEFEGSRDLLEESYELAKAGVLLYEKMHEEILPEGLCLLGEVILNRRLLKYKRYLVDTEGNDDNFRLSLEGICGKWQELSMFSMKAFERGLMRTDFGYGDKYHKFRCAKEDTVCKGVLAVLEQAGYEAVEQSFCALLTTAKRDLDLQTLSKTYRHYSEFLRRRGDGNKAIKAILDAMLSLHDFLLIKDREYKYPEQRDDCGKFDSLLHQLDKCRAGYESSEPIWGEVQSDDGKRKCYLEGFFEEWKTLVDNGQANESGRFQSLSFVLPRQRE